jgi:hypothetical protein
VGLLEQGTPGHDGLAMLVGEAGAGAGDAFQFDEDEVQRTRATSMAAVSRMSWLVAPLWTWRAASS